MDELNHLYKAVKNRTLVKEIDKLNSQIVEECPQCGKREFADYETIVECKLCNSKFFKVSMEKITDPKLLISIQQIQDIIKEYKLDKNCF